MLIIRFGKRDATVLHRSGDGSENTVSEHEFLSGPDDLIEATVAQIAAGHSRVIFDLSGVSWFGSTAIGYLIKLWKAVESAAGRGTFVNLSDRITSVFRATLVDQVFHISGSFEAAAAYLDEPDVQDERASQ